jgi:hypothetical protein
MKRNYFLSAVVALGLSFNSMAQVCTPDVNRTDLVYPKKSADVAPAIVNTPYEQVFYFKIPKDTVISYLGNNIDGIINSMTLLDIEGVPVGMSYQCNTNNCVFPGNTNGCMVISGVPTSLGAFDIVLKTKTNVTGYINGFPITTTDLYEDFPMTIVVNPDGTVSTQSASSKNKVSVYPSPTTNQARVDISAAKGGSAEISVVNLVGHRVFNTKVENFNGSYSHILNKSTLGSGLFFVYVNINGKETVSKLIIQ